MSTRIYLRIFGYITTLVMHLINIAYMSSFHTEVVKRDPEIRTFIELQARFITCWNFVFQMIYASVGLFCDIITLKKSNNKKYKLPTLLSDSRNTLFSAIVWPTSLQVAILFWPFYLYDEGLVYPAFIDRILTPLSNHIIHTAIVPVVVWEMLLQPRSPPKSHTTYVSILSVLTMLYFATLFYTYLDQNYWMYPIFGKLAGTIYFPILLVYVCVLLVFCYRSQWVIASWLWDGKSTEKTDKKKK